LYCSNKTIGLLQVYENRLALHLIAPTLSG